MKKVIFALGIIFVFACSKTEVPATPPTPVVQEEAIKFTTNLDTGTYNVADTLPLVVTVSSKLPSAGVLYSILVNWTDSSKQIFKLDSSLTVSSLSLNIPGLKKSGNYSLSVTVTSKSTSTNTLNKSLSVVNNPLGRFMGYKIDVNSLAKSKQKDLGMSYWNSTAVMLDLMVLGFQKPYGDRIKYGTFLAALAAGDFNNDGYIDVFNGGANYQGIQAKSAFLIYNPLLKKFDEKNLFNDSTLTLFNPVKVVPIYLNNDNFTDLVVFGHADEGYQNSTNQPMFICISDGKGGYDINKVTIPKEYSQFTIEGGDVGDLNGDGLPDIFITCNSHSFIYWGINAQPYFSNINYAHFASDITNFSSNNGFGEIFPEAAGEAYMATIADINKDGKNDIIIASGDQTLYKNRVLINQGAGKFNKNGLITLPVFDSSNPNVGIADFIVDDINEDGLNDIIAVNQVQYRGWNFAFYMQQSNKTFKVDNSIFSYSINSTRHGFWKPKILYYDYNGDGKKDLSYIDDADNGEIKYKSIFIRSGYQFIEQDFYQIDPYAKSILNLLK